MLLAQGDNHVISARDSVAVCEVVARPDLSTETGARNAGQMVEFLTTTVLRPGSQFRGILFDVRRGPPVFGPKTRRALAELFSNTAARGVRICVLVGDSPTQLLQFRNLCVENGDASRVFTDESEALKWVDDNGAP